MQDDNVVRERLRLGDVTQNKWQRLETIYIISRYDN